jgi:hypothetical protein
LQAIFRATRKLSDLSVFTGQLDSVQIEPGIGWASHLIFQFRHSPAALGLDVGVGSQETRQLAAQVRKGDTLTIYYDAAGTLLH